MVEAHKTLKQLRWKPGVGDLASVLQISLAPDMAKYLNAWKLQFEKIGD